MLRGTYRLRDRGEPDDYLLDELPARVQARIPRLSADDLAILRELQAEVLKGLDDEHSYSASPPAGTRR
ncbi:hypothetical protein [Synechococcus sp. BA-132 BA5]|uniref:hypothetical protein n=1 Tax=Synechococcus sp. BA-132 BA5 TaxID=3110252 RepID=UPI002B21D921|nr:hypothetical protein [Synechococcus sp. BA-132 BA5]MEA5414697.1 hypothetical protein [Synechococcus sp. BA-132 BA5]